jgi:hypothetical protein
LKVEPLSFAERVKVTLMSAEEEPSGGPLSIRVTAGVASIENVRSTIRTLPLPSVALKRAE